MAVNYFGNNTNGSESAAHDANYLQASKFRNSLGTGTLTELGINLQASLTGHIRLGVYADSAGAPGSLLLDAGVLTNPGAGWNSITGLGLSVTVDVTYWLAWLSDASTTIYQDSHIPNHDYVAQAYGALPSTFGTPGGTGGHSHCLRAGFDNGVVYFGENDNGNSGDTRSANYNSAMRFQNTAGDGNITELGFNYYTYAGDTLHVRIGVYADSGSAPGALLLDAGVITNPVFGWNSIMGLSKAVTNNTYYWLDFISDGSPSFYTNSGVSNRDYKSVTYGALPDPFGTPGGTGQSCVVMRAGVSASSSAPTVTTTTPNHVGSIDALSGGNVTSDGGATITARGICWSTSANPTTADSHTTESGTTGSFDSHATGLSPNTGYHVRAYATNSVGTSYGADDQITTTRYRVIPTGTMDSMLGILSAATRLFICSAQPTTYAEASTTYNLATQTLTGGDFSLAAGDTSGRKLTLAQKAGIPVSAGGTATHYALGISASSTLLLVGTVTSQVLTQGGTFTFPATDVDEVRDWA